MRRQEGKPVTEKKERKRRKKEGGEGGTRQRSGGGGVGVVPKEGSWELEKRIGKGGPASLGGVIIHYRISRLVGCRVGRAYNNHGAHTFRNLAWESCKIPEFSSIIMVVRLLFTAANDTEGFFHALAITCLATINADTRIGPKSGSAIGRSLLLQIVKIAEESAV